MLHTVPPKLFTIEVELGEVLLKASLAGIKLISFLIIDGHDVGYFRYPVIVHPVQLTSDFSLAALCGVA